jgi:uncharacterized protein (TIGR04255 family)
MMGETRSDSKLERPPLTLVLAEFRFARVALEGNGLVALKARLQPTFPDLQEGAAQQVRFGERGVTVELTPVLSWSTPDRGRFVHVEAERLIVATTRYPRFAGFAQHCLQVVEALLDALTPRQLLRVGLRYNDAVVPEPGESLERYLCAPLLPFAPLAENGEPVVRHLSETVVRTAAGTLVVRALVGRHGLGVMPDLEGQFTPELPLAVPSDRVTAVLDFDHYWVAADETGEAFTLPTATAHLTRLHEPAREAFWKVTTELARTVRWN